MNDSVMVELDQFLRGQTERLSPAVARVLQALERSPEQPQAWEPLADDFFANKLPAGITSCWLFTLRAGAKFQNERHPNSWQRSIALRGGAFFEIYEDDDWQPRPIDGAAATIEKRTVSIPPNVWHRIAIGPETFVSLSFHTAPAAKLIEETCVGDDFSRTQRRLYHG